VKIFLKSALGVIFAAIVIYFAPTDIVSVAIFLDWFTLIMPAVAVFVWLKFAIKLWRLKQYDRLLHILNEENNPSKFLAELTNLLDRNPKLTKWTTQATATNKALAHLNLGQFDQAAKIWEELLAEVSGKKSEIIVEHKTIYSLIATNLERGEIPKARQYCESLQILTTQKATPKYLREVFAENVEFYKSQIAFANGEIEPFRSICEKKLQEKQSTREYVELYFRLAEICEKTGDLAGQRRYLQEVAEKGNKLYFAEVARRKLA